MKNDYIKNVSKAISLAAILAFSSCEVTDLQPQNALSETTAFETPERIELAVAGVYDAAQSGFYAGGAVRGYPFGAAHCQQGDMRGEDMSLGGGATFYAITYQATYDPSSPNNGFMWQTLYNMINKANIVIDGLKKTKATATFTQERIDAYEAECRFLRALAHHQLLIHWSRPYSDNPNREAGGVPYRTTPVTGGASVDEAIKQGRNTVAECYTKILEDLDYAETKLPVSQGTRNLTRANRAAAIALKTRIRLHQNNWAAVLTEGNKLASQSVAPFSSSIGSYRLAADPMGAFGSNNKNNVESIFSIENNDVDNAGTNGSLPRMYAAVSQGGGRAIVCISPLIWNQAFWLAEDLRRSTAAVATDPTGFRFTRKYIDVTNQSDNAPIIRYAEVLLNMAEAITRTSGVDARALALLNAVRNRAVTDVNRQFRLSDFASREDLLRAIINERRIEFLAEGHRWADIHRLAQDPAVGTNGIPAKVNNSSNFQTLYTGNPATVLSMLAAIPYTDNRFLWPIPSEEIVNNPTLAKQQNPGW